MKNTKRFLLCFVMLFSLAIAPVYAVNSNHVLNVTYSLIVDEYDWGVATPRVIVNVDQEITTIDKDVLKVVETKENAEDFQRTIVDAYISDQNGQKVEGASKYFTIDLKVSPTEGSPFIYKSFNEWADPYYLTISLKENKEIIDGQNEYDTLNIDTNYTSRSLSAGDQFDYSGRYQATDGTNYSFATYSPAKDDHKNALVVWLNGGGEGGTNPQIAVLGNKVTGLISPEIQEKLGNAYVFVPQCPTLWMDGYGDFEFTESGLKFTPRHTPSTYVKSLMECIKAYVDSNDDIDTSRIYIGGCSNGGYMTMQMVLSYTDYFAAAFPICTGFDASDLSEKDAQKLKDFPLFITYCENDDTLDPNQFSRPLIEKLKAANATNLHVFSPDDVHDTSGLYNGEDGKPYQYSTHWSWIYVFNGEAIEDDTSLELFSWLSKQSKQVKNENVEIADKVEDSQKTTEKTAVKTGDNSPIFTYMSLLAVASCAYLLIAHKEYE